MSSYALVTYFAVSVNGAASQEYSPDSPGTVKPGDVITSTATGNLAYIYYSTDESSDPVKEGDFVSPLTVEAVDGAAMLELTARFVPPQG